MCGLSPTTSDDPYCSDVVCDETERAKKKEWEWKFTEKLDTTGGYDLCRVLCGPMSDDHRCTGVVYYERAATIVCYNSSCIGMYFACILCILWKILPQLETQLMLRGE